jgi:hypothetical protein
MKISGNGAKETMVMIRKTLREESVKARVFEGMLGSVQTEKGDSMFNIFFDNKGIVHKELLLASQTVNSIY